MGGPCKHPETHWANVNTSMLQMSLIIQSRYPMTIYARRTFEPRHVFRWIPARPGRFEIASSPGYRHIYPVCITRLWLAGISQFCTPLSVKSGAEKMEADGNTIHYSAARLSLPCIPWIRSDPFYISQATLTQSPRRAFRLCDADTRSGHA